MTPEQEIEKLKNALAIESKDERAYQAVKALRACADAGVPFPADLVPADAREFLSGLYLRWSKGK